MNNLRESQIVPVIDTDNFGLQKDECIPERIQLSLENPYRNLTIVAPGILVSGPKGTGPGNLTNLAIFTVAMAAPTVTRFGRTPHFCRPGTEARAKTLSWRVKGMVLRAYRRQAKSVPINTNFSHPTRQCNRDELAILMSTNHSFCSSGPPLHAPGMSCAPTVAV